MTLSNPSKVHADKHDEHYTPIPLIEMAVKVMGSIDLDPATSELALSMWPEDLRPKQYYTLDNPTPDIWTAKNVWCNPPFSQTRKFIDIAIRSAEENNTNTIFLMPANMSTKYIQKIFQDLYARELLSPVMFHCGRVYFFDGVVGKVGKSPPGSTCLFMISKDDRLKMEFAAQAVLDGHLVMDVI